MKIFIMPGHTLSGKGTSSNGFIHEGTENRVLTDLIIKWLKLGGAEVYTGRLDVAKTSKYLDEQVAIANKYHCDLAVQIHFNCSTGTHTKPIGTETFYYDNDGKVYADRVNAKLSTLFQNRGAKISKKLGWLNGTRDKAILIETCFVNSKADVDIYNANKDKVAKLIAEGLLNKSIEQKPASIDKEEVIYRVVVGSYLDKSTANQEVNKLKNMNISSFLDAFKKDNEIYYRVVVGSYSNKSNADIQLNLLKNKGYNPFIAIYKK